MQLNSLLRFDNKHRLWYIQKNRFQFYEWIKILSFSKSWDCLEFEIDQTVWNRISACIDFRLSSVTSVILVLYWTSFVSMFAEIGCVFLRGSRSAILVLVCWPRRVCVLRWSMSLSWLWCKWSRCDCLVDFLIGFSEKTRCSSEFGVNQYKYLCAFSLSLFSLISVWYLFTGINNRLFL